MSKLQIKPRELKIVSVIAATHSIGGAAALLGMAQANVSKYLSDFETRVGLKVFERTTRHLALTQFGESLLPYINSTLEQNEQLINFIADYKHEKRGKVTIYAPTGISIYLARYVIHEITDINDIRISLKTYNLNRNEFYEGVTFLLAIITGGLYPLVTTALGQWWFHDRANGSLIMQGDEIRGSRLIGQNFTGAGYFQGRPSATAESPYNPMASGGSNLAGSNPALDSAVAERVNALRAANPQAPVAVPVELVTASASGLDYSLTPDAVAWQIPRVAQARGLTTGQVSELVAKHTQKPLVGFLGMPVVNIVELNLALDAQRNN
jgi:K+-transporting ATPase ATPase C chain